jgi:hypothetical protein
MKDFSVNRVATLLLVVLLWNLVPSLMVSANAQDAKPKATSFRRFEPNVYSPELYADRLKMKFTLINLPGAEQPGSYWELSYSLYFVSEAEYVSAIKQAARTHQTALDPANFPGKILLASGSITGKRLATLKDRTRLLNGIVFKAKVPQKEQTKFGGLLTSYAVKIHDARLQSTVYDSSVWMTKPFDDDSARPGKAIPRMMIYTNFFISPKGELFKSQWPREGDNTNWP